ncbi:MAG: DUF2213 domain-containing protein [Zoogloeaceae bacterium]|jgi:hypothetical protein|nr:DUF2213 domain-containing protein [Zoogloeaceae bacterium]
MTHRIPDTNGWIEIKDNPLSAVGVYDYKGATIGFPGLDPEAPYAVLRPEEELASEETVRSARLLPWTNDHPQTLMGEDGIPAEEVGVEGVTGEDIYFKDGKLYGNIKVFSASLAEDIRGGKTELSMGYACRYERKDGEFEGKPYQFAQKDIRFNHLSLVDSGRMGPEVAVLDSDSTTTGGNIMTEEVKQEQQQGADAANPAELLEQAIQALAALKAALGASDAKPEAGETSAEEALVAAAEQVIEAAGQEGDAPVEDAENAEATPAAKAEDEKEEDPKKAPAFDGFSRVLKHLAARDRLANAIKPHVGTFDHSEMTVQDVARYGVKKLGIHAQAGAELSTLQGYLQGKQPPRPVSAVMDGDKKSFLDSYLQPETK